MVHLLSKIRAIPPYLAQRLKDRRAQRRKLSQLHIRPLRDLGHPLKVVSFKYELDSGDSYLDSVGIYRLDDVYLHINTGLCLIQTAPSDWPIGIRESGFFEYQELSLRQPRFAKANHISRSRCPEYQFDKPCFIFNINRHGNYFHFLIDSFPRLIALLNTIDEEIIVLHQLDTDGPIGEYFKLIESSYKCKFLNLPSSDSEHIKITTPTLFIEEIARRLVYSPDYLKHTWNHLYQDPQLLALGLPSDKDKWHYTTKYEQVYPKLFWLQSTKTYFKNGFALWHYSVTSMDSVFQWGTKISLRKDGALSDCQHIFIVRGNRSAVKRFLENEDELRDSLPELRYIDFAEFPVEDQISMARNCSTLIGLTGAGFANAIYMKPGSLVIDITPLGFLLPATNMVENVCKARGLRYHRLFSSPLDATLSSKIDVADLENFLKEEGVV
ncbi:MAG: glycosyltransferase family 61 protein [Betaproteobacteria bacterium]|nr:glycosyltransferase family 61 protein [Betaproteobacteria bacterium]